MKAIVTEQKLESSVNDYLGKCKQKRQFIAHQLSFDKEIHDHNLKCLHCLLT